MAICNRDLVLRYLKKLVGVDFCNSNIYQLVVRPNQNWLVHVKRAFFTGFVFFKLNKPWFPEKIR